MKPKQKHAGTVLYNLQINEKIKVMIAEEGNPFSMFLSRAIDI